MHHNAINTQPLCEKSSLESTSPTQEGSASGMKSTGAADASTMIKSMDAVSLESKQPTKAQPIRDTASMPAEGKLTSAWTLYCAGPIDAGYASRLNDLKSTQVAQFDTIALFWGTMNYVPAPAHLVVGTTYSLFRSHVQPRWEDSANECGGQWVLLLRNEEIKDKSAAMNALWEAFACALVGEDIDHGAKGINGIVLKIRLRHFAIQCWTKSGIASGVRAIGERLRELAIKHYEPFQTMSTLRLDFYTHRQMQELDKRAAGTQRPQPLLQI